MLTLFFVLVPIALLDSVSMVPLCVVPLAVILTGRNPIMGTIGLVAGILIVYATGGIILLLGLDRLMDQLRPIILRWWNDPNSLELIFQLVLGSVMLLYSLKLGKEQSGAGVDRKTEVITVGRAFVIGAGLTVASLPGALPLVGAIDQILRFDLVPIGNLIAVVFYSLVFILPIVCLFLIRVLVPAQGARLFSYISATCDKYGRRGVAVALIVIGIVFVMDAIGWFIGIPILPTA